MPNHLAPIAPLQMLARLFTGLAIGMAAASCSWVGKDGTRHTLVLGAAVISTKEIPTGKATATHTSVLGLAVRGGPVSRGLFLGYEKTFITQIPRDWQGAFSLSLSPNQDLKLQSFTEEPAQPSIRLSQQP